MSEKKSVGIILAGGIGSRFHGNQPKQYYKILGKEMIWYTIDAFQRSKNLDDFIVVVDQKEYFEKNVEKAYGVKTICGGDTRNQSMKNALDYIYVNYPECSGIVENNAACPLVTPNVIDDLLDALKKYDYAQCTYKITDALGSYTDRTVDRENFFLIQSPDAYRFPLLYRYFDPNAPQCHLVAQLPETTKGYNYFDFKPNFKVTYPEDIEIVELLLKRRSKEN